MSTDKRFSRWTSKVGGTVLVDAVKTELFADWILVISVINVREQKTGGILAAIRQLIKRKFDEPEFLSASGD